MANPWFRLYSEWSHDPKVQMMSEAMQRRFVMLLCERCECVTLHEAERAFHWRISETDLAETKAVFLQKGFIDEQWNLVNWNKRQFISDSSTERVKRHRANKKQAETLRQQRRAVTVTPPDSDSDADQKADADGVTRDPEPEPEGGAEPDSVDNRVLCETVGIHDMRQQSDMHSCLKAFAKVSGKSPPDCVAHMAKRWEEYKGKPRGQFGYKSAHRFFMSGLWDEPDKWPAEENGGNDGASKPSPTKQRVENNRRALAEAVARRGIQLAGGDVRADADSVSQPRFGGSDGGVPVGLRTAMPEILPPRRA